MPVKIITTYLEIPEDADPTYRILAENSNLAVKNMSDFMENSPMVKLDPKDGRTAYYHFKADLNNLMTIARGFTEP